MSGTMTNNIYNTIPYTDVFGIDRISSTPPIGPVITTGFIAPVQDTGDALRKDDGKLPWDLLPYDAVEEIVRVLDFGAKKYSPRGWEAGMSWSRCYAPTIRHLTKWWQGQDIDPETGISHLAHAACNILFLLAYSKRGMGTYLNRDDTEMDDRPSEAPII
jgi:hypothetical protein